MIAKARDEDPVAARSEWDAQFREDIDQYLADALIDAAIIAGRTELPYSRNHGYAGFVDVSGGVSDASVLAIAHVEPGTRAKHIVIDQLIIESAPHEPHEVVARFAAVLQRFGIRTLNGDRYGAEWPVSAFKHHNIRYEPAGSTSRPFTAKSRRSLRRSASSCSTTGAWRPSCACLRGGHARAGVAIRSTIHRAPTTIRATPAAGPCGSPRAGPRRRQAREVARNTR